MRVGTLLTAVVVLMTVAVAFLPFQARAQTAQDTLIVGLQNDTPNLHPWDTATNSVWNAFVWRNWVYEGLFGLKPDGQYYPVLADPSRNGTASMERDDGLGRREPDPCRCREDRCDDGAIPSPAGVCPVLRGRPDDPDHANAHLDEPRRYGEPRPVRHHGGNRVRLRPELRLRLEPGPGRDDRHRALDARLLGPRELRPGLRVRGILGGRGGRELEQPQRAVHAREPAYDPVQDLR